MNCVEVRKFLDTYTDGELEAGSALSVESHLDLCGPCSALFGLKRRLKTEIGGLQRMQAPSSLRDLVMGDARRRQRKVFLAKAAALPLAAAAAVVLALALPRSISKAEPDAAVIEDLLHRHVRALPMEIKGGDPVQTASWFTGKVDFPIQAGALKLKSASLEGARLSNVSAHQAAHVNYNVDGHRVTMMIFNPGEIALGGKEKRVRVGDRDALVYRRNGYNIAVLLDGDMAYALLSDLPSEKLLAMLKAM